MITVRECQYDEVKKFRDLEGEYHYMGESHGAGDMIRLIYMKGFSRRRGDGNEGKDPVSGLAWWQGEQKLGEGVDRKRREADRHLKTP